jgi:hypothetical protein
MTCFYFSVLYSFISYTLYLYICIQYCISNIEPESGGNVGHLITSYLVWYGRPLKEWSNAHPYLGSPPCPSSSRLSLADTESQTSFRSPPFGLVLEKSS